MSDMADLYRDMQRRLAVVEQNMVFRGQEAEEPTPTPTPGPGEPPPPSPAPVLVAAKIAESSLSLEYDKTLNRWAVPPPASFLVWYDGSQKTPVAVSVDGTRVTIEIDQEAVSTSVVTASYQVGSPPLQDVEGTPAAAFGPITVTNITQPPGDEVAPVLVGAEVNGERVFLHYDEALDPASVPVNGDFFITADGSQVVLSGVSLSGTVVTVRLWGKVLDTTIVRVTYDPGASPIRDVAGNESASLDKVLATNLTIPDVPEPPKPPPEPPPPPCAGGTFLPQGTSSNWIFPQGDMFSIESVIFMELAPTPLCGGNPLQGYFYAAQFASDRGAGGYMGIQTHTFGPHRYNQQDADRGHIPTGFAIGDLVPGWAPSGEQRLAIFSLWDLHTGDTVSGDTVPVLSNQLGAIARRWRDDGEGIGASGSQTAIPYNWEQGHYYRVRIQSGGVAEGRIQWRADVTDGGTTKSFSEAASKTIGWIRWPLDWGRLHYYLNQFGEYVGAGANHCGNLPKTMTILDRPRGNGGAVLPGGAPNYGAYGAGCTSSVTLVTADRYRHIQGRAT